MRVGVSVSENGCEREREEERKRRERYFIII